jgi:excisionase family DNA binding protein
VSRVPNQTRRQNLPLWLTAEEAAEVLRISVGHVYELCRQGAIPHLKIGRTVRIDRDGLFYQAREGTRRKTEVA